MRTNKLLPGLLPVLGVVILLGIFSVRLFPLNQPGDTGGGSSQAENKITVIALYPSIGTIKDLMTLRENKLIDVPNLEVVGVYHEKETTDYQKSKGSVAARGRGGSPFLPAPAP